jgi:hypothetical protein
MSRTGVLLGTLSATLAVALSVGCITFINADPGGLSTQGCGFKGSDGTACGACIAAKCQAQVDGCCRDKRCREYELERLDTCATGDVAECGRFFVTDAGTALEECIKGACGAPCLADDAGAPDGGGLRTRCSIFSESCTCVPDPVGNDTVCTPAAITGGSGKALCCVDEAWPANGASCTCKWWGCTPTSSGCRCSAISGAPYEECDGKLFNYCCRSILTGDCVCRDQTDCSGTETRVPSCSLEYACGTGKIRVTQSCSITN